MPFGTSWRFGLGRRVAHLALGAAVLGLAGNAAAQGVDELGTYGPIAAHDKESPQNAAVEIRVGPYYPKVDSEFNGAASPFATTFGDSTHWAVGIESDWQALRLWNYASLGVGTSISYTAINGATFDESGVPVEGVTSTLRIIPMNVLAVGRFDYLIKETEVPLAFYAKAGFAWAFWNSSNSVRESVSNDGVTGSGISTGPQFALGGMLLLDPIGQKEANMVDTSWGINNTYVFFEWMTSQLGEYSDTELRVGTDSWLIGVTMEL